MLPEAFVQAVATGSPGLWGPCRASGPQEGPLRGAPTSSVVASWALGPRTPQQGGSCKCGSPAGNPEVSKHRPLAPATHQGGPERSTLTFRGFRSHLGSVPQTGFRGTLSPEAARGNDFRGQIGSEPLHVLLSEGRSPGQSRGARASSVLPVDSPWKGREPALCPRWVQRDPLPALGLARGLSGGWAPCCSASPSGTGAGGASAPSVGAPFRPCGRITEWGAGALSRPELEVHAVTMALQTCPSSCSWSLGRLGTRGVPHPVQGG